MALTHISNGDSGLSARTTLNTMIDEVNALYLPPASGTAPALTDTIQGITGGAYKQYTINQIGQSLGLTPATSNIIYNVTNTATLNAALVAVTQVNWVGQFIPTIQLAAGTYPNFTGTLPVLFNCPGRGIVVGDASTPTNVKVVDNGTDTAFTVAPGAAWNIGGIDFGGTMQAVATSQFSYVQFIDKNNFSGNFTHPLGAILCSAESIVEMSSGVFTITATSMTGFAFTLGGLDLDNASVAFLNPITFGSFFLWADDNQSFIAMDSCTFTGASNVTVATNASLLAVDGAYIEADGNTLVDGVVMSRSVFPGVGSAPVTVDGFSTFMPDNGKVLTTGQVFGWSDNTTGSGSVGTGLSNAFFQGLVLVGNGNNGDFTGSIGAQNVWAAGANGAVGYCPLGIGSGGSYSQSTNKSTGVTVTTPAGQITMANSALAGGAKVSFVVSASNVASADVISVSIASGGTANAYRAYVTATSTGSCTVTVENITAGSLSESPVINYVLIRGSTI